MMSGSLRSFGLLKVDVRGVCLFACFVRGQLHAADGSILSSTEPKRHYLHYFKTALRDLCTYEASSPEPVFKCTFNKTPLVAELQTICKLRKGRDAPSVHHPILLNGAQHLLLTTSNSNVCKSHR